MKSDAKSGERVERVERVERAEKVESVETLGTAAMEGAPGRSVGRRQFLRTAAGGLAVAGAGVFPSWLMPALAQDETLVPFLDMPDSFQPGPPQPGSNHFLDTRQIDSFYTSNDDFYIVQHYGQPELDLDTYRLRVTGLVDRELSLSLADLQQMASIERDVGFECGGNGARMFHGLVGNAKWGGVSLRQVLEQAGLQDGAREIVFFGADRGSEEIRGREVEQSFARSLSIADAMREENLLALEMNDEALPLYHGRPLRLIVPGWYGVANVKWLEQIHVQDRRYMGRFMARDYVTLKRDEVGGEERWMETSVSRMRLKSVITRVVRSQDSHSIQGFVLNDGTPLDRVELRIDDGPWREARIDPESSDWSWKLFSYDWADAAPGEHRLESRVWDVEGNVQAVADELPEQVSYWEEFARFPRRVTIT